MITGPCAQIGSGRQGQRVRRVIGARRGSAAWHYQGCECPWPVTQHEETAVDLHGHTALIDTAIVPLITELNADALLTQYSCQGNGHRPGYVIVLSQDPAVVGQAALTVCRHRGRAEIELLTGQSHMPGFGPRTILRFPGEGAVSGQSLART